MQCRETPTDTMEDSTRRESVLWANRQKGFRTNHHPHHQILDIAPLFRPGGRVLQLFTSCGEHSRSRQKQMELYPEGGPERGCICFVQRDYEEKNFTFHLTEIGQVLHTTKHHFYRSHVDGEPLTIYIFDAVR